MPQFDLKYVQAAKYNNANGVTSYTDKTKVGDAMTANMELKFAEGRLYAESSLAEYLRKATGGTASIGTKYILDAAQTLLYGATTATRTVNGKEIPSMVYAKTNIPNYVGVSFYAEDAIDGETKFTCVLIKRARFGPPSMKFETVGQNVTFQTPTTTGEMLSDHSTSGEIFETAVCDTEEDAIAWCDLVLGEPAAATPTATPSAGAVASGSTITLASATAGAKIYYTLNGTTPTTASAVYNATAKPAITAATTLKAIAVKDGYSNSAVLTAAYTVH
jgi:hypothetical protein